MLSDVVADRIVAVRKQLGLTREDVAQRCEALGWPALTYGVISSIETGRRDQDGRRRREVTVDELVVIAHSLGVPPALLVAPLGDVDSVELLPGETVDTLSAFEYFTAGSMAANRRDTGAKFVIRSQPPLVVRTYREYEQAVLRWMATQTDKDETERTRWWSEVQTLQKRLQDSGWRIPPMPVPQPPAPDGEPEEGSS